MGKGLFCVKCGHSTVKKAVKAGIHSYDCGKCGAKIVLGKKLKKK